ncbi:MAG: hypothetical protein N5P05_000880 [Chroococcopsis gigantea SAG 12.99]|jgi:uncharacterized membrane protein|nr:DUF1517 domain-containing protein [Chlorogloea purpurea SAG 13.99]MDV2999274.1 hypothetical protein [Chroococcopsis gigantea SAG 12.99]
MIDKFLKTCIAFGLVITLTFGSAHSALAARSGGRIGGGSFSAPSRSIAPSRGGGGYAPGPSYGGGGIGFPFLLPLFWGGGGGGIFTILIMFAIASFLVNTFRKAGGGDDGYSEYDSYNPTVTVAKVQVGLLANARYLQEDLNKLAISADTSTPEGRADVLQESALALLRHPEYWVYGASDSEVSTLNSAEAKFNQWSLGERSKVTSETLVNVNNQLRQADSTPTGGGELSTEVQEPGEYILVTVLVGVQGNLQLPSINGSDDLRQAVQKISSIGSDRLLAVEVLWTPQSEGDVLTTDDILANYPNLKLV